jgi:hypothetical protein
MSAGTAFATVSTTFTSSTRPERLCYTTHKTSPVLIFVVVDVKKKTKKGKIVVNTLLPFHHESTTL